MNNTVITRNELMEKADEIKDLLGADGLLEALLKAMDSDDLRENLEYIDRMNDTGLFA